MKRAKKVKAALARRVSVWENMPANGILSPSVKVAKGEPLGNGMAYHKPGSQNTKKGRSGRSSTR